jgi:diguanylate cyclase (GGDEF)-like protein
MSATKTDKNKSVPERLTDESGLAVVVVDENAQVLNESNNNSMCRALYGSREFAPECDKFCGRAFQMTKEAGDAVEYKCYAGLNCVAVPVEENAVAITGRAFLKAEDYRTATERAIKGDWNRFAPTEFFENVLLSGSSKTLEKLAKQIGKLDAGERSALIGEETESATVSKTNGTLVQTRSRSELAEIGAWRSLFGSLLNLSYENAYKAIMRFAVRRYALRDLAWLERIDGKLEIVFAAGYLKTTNAKIGIAADDPRILDAARRDGALEFRDRKSRQLIRLFPIAIGEDVSSALVVGDEIKDAEKIKNIARFCRSVASKLEILRLREQLSKRAWVERAVRTFNENLKNADSEDFWARLVQTTAELLRAERSSLLLFDEKTEAFEVKAATGARADIIKNLTEGIGERVAANVLAKGAPVVVKDVKQSSLGAAPAERNYKTDSFISYPITVGERKIGVLNATDRTGEVFGEKDLELLDAIAPQLGVLIDRVTLKGKAKELTEISVTDELTGLLNRRYLQPRLEEEIKRSNRYGYPMSFVLIDIDDFGKFNKDFGILVGDEVLRQAVKAMTSTLRGEDVAARYGGEEFCVLLPQTNLKEAVAIAERMRQSVEKIDFPSRKITISLGVTTFSRNVSTSETIIKTADEALRKAKQSGKNNVQIFADPGNGTSRKK